MGILTSEVTRSGAVHARLAERIVEAVRSHASPAAVSTAELVTAAEAVSARIQLSAPALDPTDPSKPWI
jgi:phosphotransferase system HPr-like phosphotransfer protein